MVEVIPLIRGNRGRLL